MTPEIHSTEAISRSNHIALHLAHRWFAFLEAPGGDVHDHLKIFHPNILLSGHRMKHIFAHDHQSLAAWFASIPDVISSHHIIHSNYSTAENGDGLLNMVVAYQAPGPSGMQGSIISYETRIDFSPSVPCFIALDKTPILSNRRSSYETSWSTNRVLARVHAELGGLTGASDSVRRAFENEVHQLSARVAASEGSSAYDAVVSAIIGDAALIRVLKLRLIDDVGQSMPSIETAEVIDNGELPI